MAKTKRSSKVGIGVGLAAAGAAIAYFLWKKGPAQAQDLGSAYGYITDSATGLPIVGEYVYIDGYKSSAKSAGDGYFICNNMPEGQYSTLSVTGYQSVSL